MSQFVQLSFLAIGFIVTNRLCLHFGVFIEKLKPGILASNAAYVNKNNKK